VAMAVVELTLFGGFEGRLAGGQVIALSGQKDRALLAILALQPGATHTRDKLTSLLWSDRGDQQARDSLKHSLTRIRQCLEPSAVVADRRSVRLDPAAVASDVATFERLLVEETPEAMEQASVLYRGDLLDGIGIRDPAFEDWLLVERQRLRQRCEEALTKLLAQSTGQGTQARAAAAARRLLSLDPLREAACRALMQLHAEQSQIPQAIKLYETLRDRLHACWMTGRNRPMGGRTRAVALAAAARPILSRSRGIGSALYTMANSPTRPQHHDVAARTVYDEVDPLGPGLEGLALFLQILVPIISACQSPRGMAQDAVNGVLGDLQRGEARAAGPAQVM
jgi:DNA-binding SARP family transcriptional activator